MIHLFGTDVSKISHSIEFMRDRPTTNRPFGVDIARVDPNTDRPQKRSDRSEKRCIVTYTRIRKKSGYRSDNPLFVLTGGSEDVGYGHRLLIFYVSLAAGYRAAGAGGATAKSRHCCRTPAASAWYDFCMNVNRPEDFDVVVLGAGAAGLMCAITAGARGRRVRYSTTPTKSAKRS